MDRLVQHIAPGYIIKLMFTKHCYIILLYIDLVASSKRYCQDREMSEDSLSFSDTSSQSDDSQDKLTSSGK